MKKLAILLALVLLLFAVSGLAEGEAVVLNGGFESVDDYDFPTNWEFHSYEAASLGDGVSSAVCVTDDERGSNVLHVQVIVLDDAAVFQTVEVEPSTCYKLTCWIRTEGVAEGAGANIALRDIIAVSDQLFGDNGWTLVTLVGVTGPEQYDITVSCRVGGYGAEAKGEAWFDDFTIEKLGEAPEGALPFYSSDDGGDWENGEDDGGEGTGKTPDNIDKPNPSSLGTLLIILAALVFCGVGAFLVIRNLRRKDDNFGTETQEAENANAETESELEPEIRGKMEVLSVLVKDGTITPDRAAELLQITVEEFEKATGIRG